MKSWCLKSFRLMQAVFFSAWLAISAAPTTARADPGADIYKFQSPGVLLIRAAAEDETGAIVSSEIGTGFIVSADGDVLTASHVIPDSAAVKKLYITGTIGPNTADQKPFRLELIKRSDKYDAALLKIVSPPKNLFPLSIRKKDAIGGEQLFVLGYPLGLPNIFFLPGSVSSIDGVDLATNVLINKGNSGGPVFDQFGCVIGLVYSGIESFEGKQIVGIKFALRVAAFNDLIPKNTGEPSSPPTETMNDKAIRVSDTLSRIQTDHGFTDTIRQYSDQISARPGYIIKEIIAVEKTSLNPPALTFPDPNISSDGKYMSFKYNLLSGPIYDQRRGWIDMNIHTLQMPEGQVQSSTRPKTSCQ